MTRRTREFTELFDFFYRRFCSVIQPTSPTADSEARRKWATRVRIARHALGMPLPAAGPRCLLLTGRDTEAVQPSARYGDNSRSRSAPPRRIEAFWSGKIPANRSRLPARSFLNEPVAMVAWLLVRL